MRLRCGLTVLLLISAAVAASNAAELNPQALASWNSYIATANMRMQERMSGTIPFLWIDEDPTRRQHLRAGEVVVLPLGKGSSTVPHGLIHHWIGGVFIPGAQREDLITVMNDYSSYDKVYRPTVIKAELLDSTGDEQKFSLLWVQRVLFATVALDVQFDSNSAQLNRRQGYMTLCSTSVQQIEHYGQKDERKLQPDEGSGYLWRVASFARFEERDGGLYLELEVFGLSRDLPASLRLFLKPVIEHVPRQALSTKLDQTREAVRSQVAKRASALLNFPYGRESHAVSIRSIF